MYLLSIRTLMLFVVGATSAVIQRLYIVVLFFEESHLDLRTLVLFIYLWANGTPQNTIVRECGIDKATIVEWYIF